MIIDLQMTTDHFLLGIRNELRSQPVCFAKEVTVDNETLLLDHVEVSDNTSVKRIPRRTAVTGHDPGPPHPIDGSAVQVTQEVLLHFTSLSALQGNGAAPTPPSPNPAVTVHFVLTIVLVDEQPRLRVEYRPPADAGPLELLVPGAGQQIDATLSTLFGSVPIDLRNLEVLVQAKLRFANAGMVVGNLGAVITIRLEVGTDIDNISTWTQFFAGATPSLLNGRQWGIFLDRRLLVPVALQLFGAAEPHGGVFNSSGPPSAIWSANGHGIHVTQSGVLPNAGPLNADVDVTFEADLDFLIPAPDVLIFRLSLAASGSAGGIIGAVLDFLGMDFNPTPALPSMQGWTKVGDSAFEHKEFLFIGNPLLGHLTVEQVVPDGNGLHLVGSVHSAWPVTTAALVATLKPFEWGLRGSCNKGFRITQGGYLGLNNTGSAPLKVCEARVLFDPDGQFPCVVETAKSPSSEFAFVVRVEFTELKPAYLNRAAPYPCLVLVKTNGGARVVTLGVPGGLTADARHALEFEGMIRVVNCKQLVDDFYRDGRLEPKWIPDPVPDLASLHLWQVLISGLNDNERIVLLDRENRELAVGEAGAGGIAYARAVATPVQEGREVTVLRANSRQPTSERERSIQIRQVLIESAATLRTEGQPISLRMGRYRDVPVIIMVGSSRAQVYNVREPARPILVQDVAVSGLESGRLDLALRDIPAEFGELQPGATYMREGGVVLGDVFARWQADHGTVTIYGAKQVAVV